MLIFLIIFNEGNVFKGRGSNHVFLRGMPSIEIKVPGSVIYLRKLGSFEYLTNYFALGLQLFYSSFDFLKN